MSQDAASKGGERAARLPETVRFHYIKNSQFRVIHADGAHGGITPWRFIEVNFYSERAAIPQVTVHKVAPDGKLTEIVEERIAKEGLVREIDVGVILDLRAAERLHVWLGEKIATLKKLVGEVEAPGKGGSE